MPPKKKGKGKGKGKKGKKKKNDAELTIEDKYKKTLNEIEALKDHLSLRKQLARRAESHSEEWKLRMKMAQEDLEQQKVDQKDVASDMTRQYKTMQTEMGVRVRHLEADLAKTKAQLAKTEQELKATKEEKEQMTKQKDETIAELEEKIRNMEFSYENMLHEALDNLVMKLDVAKKRWEAEATHIHTVEKEKLLAFGLNPLDI
ncbi:coiled-coil domain-containing protein 153-like [Acanthaster planci]|uniref:Dynein regulatory complex protein 12 n=1 Tax=Acanthaster planci TaxID=133434 RepID=A0A8B7Z8Q7_ACAPL|nr:coiled-coil domain-containing protein 153-like [Acanthaster planci]